MVWGRPWEAARGGARTACRASPLGGVIPTAFGVGSNVFEVRRRSWAHPARGAHMGSRWGGFRDASLPAEAVSGLSFVEQVQSGVVD